MPPKLDYAIGDPCWISLGEEKLTRATVVGTFTLHTHPTKFFILEPGSEYLHLEIRDALLMSPGQDEPLTIWSVPIVGRGVPPSSGPN